jgi:hypothetical protein
MVRVLGFLHAIVQLSLVGVHFLTLRSNSMTFLYFCNIQTTSSNFALMFHQCDLLASLMLKMNQALGRMEHASTTELKEGICLT